MDALPYHLPMSVPGRVLRRSGLTAATAALLTSLLIFLLALAGTPGTAASAPTPVTSGGDGAVTGAPVESAGVWTSRRMMAARPAAPPDSPESAFDTTGPLSDPTAGAGISAAEGDFFPTDVESFPLRVHGKVFFRIGDSDFECSGTVVDSKEKNVVFTAGHCVYDIETEGYVDQLVFVPAFQDGATPLGIWPATAVYTTSRYVERGALSHDIGAVVLEDRIQNELGARKIAFGLDPEERPYTIYGYPAAPDPPYDGGSLAGCRSVEAGRDPVQGDPAPIAAGPCTMEGGSSGGGWVTGGGLLSSVVSYTYCGNVPELCGFIFGPFFSTQALDLYTFPAVGGSAFPTVKIRSSPPRRLSRNRAKFKLSGSGSTPVSYRCRLDRRSPFECGKKVVFKRLSVGRHVFRVNSVDQTGKASPRAAKRVFRVLRRRG